MGGKPSNAMGRDRPESGGADHDMAREKSGILEQDKQKFAQEESEERRSAQTEAEQSGSPQPFSIDSPPNSDPRK